MPTPGGRPADVTWNPSWSWAAGGIVSNVADLGRFYSALLRGELVPPERLREMKATVPGFSSDEYGLGIQRKLLPCATVWGHSGGVPGYTTLVYSSEDGLHQTIVMVNTSVGPGRLAFRFDALGSAFCR